MTDAQQPPPELPRTLVLGYLPQPKSVLRARRMVALGVAAVGVAAIAIGGGMLVYNAWQVYADANHIGWPFPGPLPPPNYWEAWLWRRESWNSLWVSLTYASPIMDLYAVLGYSLGSLAGGIILLVCIPMIIRGHLSGCGTARILLKGLIALAALFAAILTYHAVAILLYPQPFRFYMGDRPLWLPRLLALPAGILAILLMNDLCAYLIWFIRNPDTDKPKVHFISGRQSNTGQSLTADSPSSPSRHPAHQTPAPSAPPMPPPAAHCVPPPSPPP